MNARLSILETPQQFFKERVDEAKLAVSIPLNQDVEFYLVNLLCDFINPEKINQALAPKNTSEEKHFMNRPLAFIFQDALQAPEHERLEKMRRLGDISLYISGFFQDYFNRKTFDMSYYVDLGSNAYDQVAVLKKSKSIPEGHQSAVFGTMSRDFSRLVDLVSHVAESFHPSAQDTLAIYEKWLHIESKRHAQNLLDRGIIPIKTKLRLAQ